MPPSSSFSRPTTLGDPSTPQVDSSQVSETTIYFVFKLESQLLNMHDSIFLYDKLLTVARHPCRSGQDLPHPVHLPRGHYRLRQDSGRLWVQAFWVPPVQPYPGQPGGHPPPQIGQGYWPPLPLGSLPGGQPLPPFGSPPLRSLLLRPMTSTPPMVRNYFAILTRPFCILNTFIYMSFRAAQDHKATSRGYNFVEALFNPTEGSDGNNAAP
jgi:hypothetical protein